MQLIKIFSIIKMFCLSANMVQNILETLQESVQGNASLEAGLKQT